MINTVGQSSSLSFFPNSIGGCKDAPLQHFHMPMKGQAVVLAILNIPYTVKLFIEGELSVGTTTKSMRHLFQGGVIRPKEDVSVFYEETYT